MVPFEFFKSESKVGVAQIEELEAVVGQVLPASFKDFYMSCNGGVPSKDWWDSDDEYEPVRVKKFKAVAPLDAPDASETKFLGGCYVAMVAKTIIPKTLLPFAIDDGGNFFCLDLADGNVCFFATDSFDSELSAAANHAKAYRWLSNSFEEFVSGLKDELDLEF
ncbi:SMI1/KNR4 family protein [Pseudomonas viridiflava]|uniref:SMI1/KNR4 family protein n=1 Tax=Pseudomonas viridiflava TaxID=33069 RepID=UPI000F04104C|nr:SMI1/KNR4 family protein [Pseudomonas viridiflava]